MAVFASLALAYVLIQRFYFNEENQAENQEKEPGKTPEIAKNILIPNHSRKSKDVESNDLLIKKKGCHSPVHSRSI